MQDRCESDPLTNMVNSQSDHVALTCKVPERRISPGEVGISPSITTAIRVISSGSMVVFGHGVPGTRVPETVGAEGAEEESVEVGDEGSTDDVAMTTSMIHQYEVHKYEAKKASWFGGMVVTKLCTQ